MRATEAPIQVPEPVFCPKNKPIKGTKNIYKPV